MPETPKTVFISYRHEVSPRHARAIFMDLHEQGYNVFMDVGTVDRDAFEAVTLDQIAARAHFILLLAPAGVGGAATLQRV